MAHRSRPKNIPREPERGKRGLLSTLPGPTKPHPGYPGLGPPLPGEDSIGVKTQRSPLDAERYLPEWTSGNAKSNKVINE